ncbi:MAG TPA: efflux RND transporter periplasmic adaptor subunit [Leptolyngbyaceae cyanobacterium M33_DOE_097]|uniref:Efflux RND transporter periplasmic adaptor subunit n=1 Tax=Oscillatoriales cyanobacterium SpSt-418 TaxID=2282169 RepID=A0A7C3KH74_9CYAN|nr:efflux RND transporter periplasmic adaptor subunit [Leptolyngbyaceae cyanobacterium M33_DOE_097]
MTHTTSHESLDETMDGAVEPKELPAPRLPQKKWGLIAGGALLLLGGVWVIVSLTRSTNAPEVAITPTTAVETLTIQARPIASTLQLSGTIRPVDQATLSTRVMGRITQLSLEAGDRFRKGEVLARVDVMDISAQTNQALTAVAQAEADVSRSQAVLNQLEAQKLEAQAALQLAQIHQSRMARLQAVGAVSQSRLDEANSTFDQAKSRVAQMQAGIQQARAAIAQSQAAVNRAKAGVTSASASESYGTVIAPFDGVVVQKLAYEGEMAAPGTALLKVENPNRLQLEISVPEENLRFVRVGQPIQVRVDAVNQTLNATIGQIVPAADPNSRSFLVKIPLNNFGRLISGMFGRIALPSGKKQETILIPANAMVQKGQLQGTYVVDTSGEQPIAVLRWVKTGQQHDGQVEIVSGLMTGDRIVTNHINQLADGQVVELEK